MKTNERLAFYIGLLIVALFDQGCVSLQIASDEKKPQIVGFGFSKLVREADATIWQAVTPGLSVRVGSIDPGISFGWHEARLFYPSGLQTPGAQPKIVAFQVNCIGMDIQPTGIMIGWEKVFSIPMPKGSNDIVQDIEYSERFLQNTIVDRKEIK